MWTDVGIAALVLAYLALWLAASWRKASIVINITKAEHRER